ncbi:hypothetical protein P4576_14265 [Peribacillus frigoritolerans]|uniref:hypothetical protein n=1 Tax=Peribacillus frigoritolerans TaxID=450367 RepID=UPI002E1B2C18|nr:hypothetical protein [Peribacillus frigoritolerans]
MSVADLRGFHLTLNEKLNGTEGTRLLREKRVPGVEIILLTLKSAASARLFAKPNQSKRFRLTSHSARV